MSRRGIHHLFLFLHKLHGVFTQHDNKQESLQSFINLKVRMIRSIKKILSLKLNLYCTSLEGGFGVSSHWLRVWPIIVIGYHDVGISGLEY